MAKKKKSLAEQAEASPPSRKQLEAIAAQDAKDLRMKFRKGGGVAIEADLVRDILRVADDPLNPYPGTCSRARYKRLGHFPESVVYDAFGNHSEFQRAAGLRDFRTTTAVRNRRAILKSEERILEYAKAHVLPWAGAFERKQTGDFRMVVGSDFHGHECDRFALEVFLDVIRRVQPEVVVLNGDVVDFYEVGKWSKNPRRVLDLQSEIDWTKENLLAAVRGVAPDAQVDWIIGNHEYRLVRFLADSAPELASLRSLGFEEMFGLQELRINMVWNDANLAPNEANRRATTKKTWKVYGGCFVCTHGTSAGKFPADKELSRFGMSGTSGHVHRPQMVSVPTFSSPYADWMTTGMMAENDLRDGAGHGSEFKTGPSTWTTGFGVVSVHPERGVAFQTPVVVKNGLAEFGGVVYDRRR